MNGHIANLFVFLTCEGQSNDCMIWSEALLLAEVRVNSSILPVHSNTISISF